MQIQTASWSSSRIEMAQSSCKQTDEDRLRMVTVPRVFLAPASAEMTTFIGSVVNTIYGRVF